MINGFSVIHGKHCIVEKKGCSAARFAATALVPWYEAVAASPGIIATASLPAWCSTQ